MSSHRISYLFSRQLVIRLTQYAPLSGNWLTEMNSSVYEESIEPWLIAPMMKTIDSLQGKSFTNWLRSWIAGALNDKPTLRIFVGTYWEIGPLKIFKSFSEPFEARMENFWRSWTIRPQKRLNVRGMRVCGLTLNQTFFWVCTKTAAIFPALFKGLSRTASSSWWIISGR